MTWNSKGTFTQISSVAETLILQEHAGPVAETAELSKVTSHLYPLASFHISEHFTVHLPNPMTITHCTVTILSTVCMGLYATQFTWRNLFSLLRVSR